MAAVGAAVLAIGGWLGGGSIMATVVGRLLVTTAVSALSRALQRSAARRQRQPGIQTEYTTDGGAVPQSFLLGWYATAGHMVCPPMSHGKSGKSPNAFLTYVICLGNIPGQQLEKVIIDDKDVTFEADDQTIPRGGATPRHYQGWWYAQQGKDKNNPDAGAETITPGRPATGKHKDSVWLRYYDGRQTAADPYLVNVYGPGTPWAAASKRPWQSDMAGIGTCYAILTFKLDRKLFPGLPRCRFVMSGIPLYDPRLDDTAGGSGHHRAGDQRTWNPSNNAMVQAYNILRGIPIDGGPVWGYGVSAASLPVSAWVPAMNACDDNQPGEPRWRAGIEVSVDDEPADLLDELGKVACADFAEVGGIWKPRVGGPAGPVYFFTDDDLLIGHESTFNPFPPIDDTYNGVQASYPDPAQLWQSKDAPPRYNADWEATDNGRRRVANLTLPACPYPKQVQRIMRGYIEEERRFRRHVITLPPDASALEPLDTVSWTSATHGCPACSRP